MLRSVLCAARLLRVLYAPAEAGRVDCNWRPDEGRVLIDRDGEWDRLCKHRSALRARALRAHRRQMAGAARAIEELTA